MEPDCRYVHFLFDDDVIFPGFTDTHLAALEASKSAVVSVSARWAIDERNFICGDFPVPGDSQMLAIANTLVAGTIQEKLTSFNSAWRSFSEAILKPLLQ